jgi:hypothetical protein
VLEILTNIGTFVTSPPVGVALGLILGTGTAKLFKAVGDVLGESTNREIARWLKVKTLESTIIANEAITWPDTFAKMFDRVFGSRHLSWRCFFRSSIASWASLAIVLIGAFTFGSAPLRSLGPTLKLTQSIIVVSILYGLLFNVLPDFLSLLESRLVLFLMKQAKSGLVILGLLILDLYITAVIATFTALIGLETLALSEAKKQWLNPILMGDRGDDLWFALTRPFHPLRRYTLPVVLWYVPAFFTSVWLWLYAGSGFVLKALRRFDLGFEWFNRRFDVDKKPVQAIGVIAGSFVALVCWVVVVIVHFG